MGSSGKGGGSSAGSSIGAYDDAEGSTGDVAKGEALIAKGKEAEMSCEVSKAREYYREGLRYIEPFARTANDGDPTKQVFFLFRSRLQGLDAEAALPQ